MESLSVTQEFVLCALKEDGKIPLLKATEVTVCLVSSGVWELVHHHAVRYDDKEDLVCAGALPKQVAYLQPLYEQIKEREPVSAHKLVENYVFAATEKNLHQLIEAIGAELEQVQCGEVVRERGLLHEKVRFHPNQAAVQQVVDKVRDAFFSDSALSDNIVALAALLEESGMLRQYFSKFEADTLRQRLKELANVDEYAFVAGIMDNVETLIELIEAAGVK